MTNAVQKLALVDTERSVEGEKCKVFVESGFRGRTCGQHAKVWAPLLHANYGTADTLFPTCGVHLGALKRAATNEQKRNEREELRRAIQQDRENWSQLNHDKVQPLVDQLKAAIEWDSTQGIEQQKSSAGRYTTNVVITEYVLQKILDRLEVLS